MLCASLLLAWRLSPPHDPCANIFRGAFDMRNCVYIIGALFLLLHGTTARADDAGSNAKLLKSQPNGCGSGWSVYLVPDSIPLAHCTFRAACDGHDDCYGKCEGRVQDRRAPQCEYLRCREGGDLYKQPRCQSDPKFAKLDREAQKRRSACDKEIGAKIRKINAGKPVCQAFAYVYENAVKRFGDPFFKGIRISSLLQSKEEYDDAIREFFRRGMPDEFEAFNAHPPSFDRDLTYEPGKGLINVP